MASHLLLLSSLLHPLPHPPPLSFTNLTLDSSQMGEVIIMNRLFPEWKPHSDFIVTGLERALALDAKRSSHPIQVDCPDANQINQIVSYCLQCGRRLSSDREFI